MRVFDFHKLKKKSSLILLKNGLKILRITRSFLKYLSQSKYLDVFRDELIFLAQDGDLYICSDLLINLGSDELEIEWLSFEKVLNSDVLA
jgi:hypothetical protein